MHVYVYVSLAPTSHHACGASTEPDSWSRPGHERSTKQSTAPQVVVVVVVSTTSLALCGPSPSGRSYPAHPLAWPRRTFLRSFATAVGP